MPRITTSSFPQPAKMGAAIKITLIAAMAVVVIGGAYLGWQAYTSQQVNQARSVAQIFIADLTAGKAAAAYTMTSLAVQKNSTQDQFAANFADLATASPTYSGEAVVASTSKASYQAVLDGLPATKSGVTKASFALKLIKSGGHWQVDSIDVE